MNEDKQVWILNPLNKEFSMEIFGDQNQIERIVIPSMETRPFDAKIAPVIKRHLVNLILTDKGAKTDDEEERKISLEWISVKT